MIPEQQIQNYYKILFNLIIKNIFYCRIEDSTDEQVHHK